MATIASREDPRSAASGSTGLPPPASIRFENRQPGSGVDFVLDNATTEDKPIIDSMLGGVALLDYDQDGLLDIYFTNGARIPGFEKDSPKFSNRLYRNEGGGRFRDVTEPAGVRGAGYSMGAAAGDFDNDGYPDLYVTGYNVNILYRNQGDGTFEDVTRKAGVEARNAAGEKMWSVAAAWLDYDNDGGLDLFVANYLDWSLENNKVCGEPGQRISCSPVLYDGLPNTLYRNRGDGTFEDVSQQTGIAEHTGKGMGVAVADYDQDGFTDIFVANDRVRNFLFRNERGERFTEAGVAAGVAFTEDGVPVSSMGVDFRDVNNDGLPDVWVTALTNETYPLFLNQGKGLFADATYTLGVGLASYTMSGWGNGVFDFDNDGFKDLFAANSHVSENIAAYRPQKYKLRNAVLQNRGGKFEDVTDQAGPGLKAEAAHRGCAFGDLDNDGKIDVVVSVIGEPAELLYNVSDSPYHWLLLDVRGRIANRDGIGVKIRLTGESGRTQYNHVTRPVGYASSSDRRVHFGLGADESVREIELVWPGGERQRLEDVAADQIFTIQQK